MSEKRDNTRADLVRQRLQKESTQRVERATKRAYNPVKTVPVARNKGYVPGKAKRIPARRQFNIAIGIPSLGLNRSTLRLPQLRTGWRTASLTLTLVLGLAIFLVWNLPYFHATWATTLGNSRLTSEEINAVLGITGQPIFTIKPEEVEIRLRMNYPELASADVDVYFPNYVYVTVTERQPVILWQQGEGYTWIDAEGVAFRPRGVVPGLVPVVGNGNPPTGVPAMDDPLNLPRYLSKDMVDAILLLAPHVPAGNTMIYDPRNGLGWNDPRGWQAFFGLDAKDMALKLRVYQSLVDSLIARGVTPVLISVAYVDAPYYRLAQPSESGDVGE